MKNISVRITISLLLAIIAGFLSTAPFQAQTPQPVDLPTSAQEFVNLLADGLFEPAAAAFDPQLADQAPPEMLIEAWNALIGQLGAFQEVEETALVEGSGLSTVYVTTRFEKGALDIKVVYNPAGQVIGMFFTPAGSGKAAGQPYSPAPYTRPGSISEQEVTIGQAPFALPGTLTLPQGEGPFPAVVLVHGSGPNDRDETILANKPFRDLAEGLSSQGIAVLRYDKRTKVYPEEMIDRLTTKEEVTDDALAALVLLQDMPGIDPQRLYLLGHSLGGLLAPRIASQAPDLAGAIILAGPTRPLEDLMVEQTETIFRLDGTLDADEQSRVAELKRQAANVKDPDLASGASPDQVLGISPAYWLDLRDYDPAATAAELDLPLFIAQGERDYQVTTADFAGWQAALEGKPNTTLKLYPGLNHLFMHGAGPSTPQEYEQAGHISELIVNDIAGFINTGSVKPNIPWIGGRMSQQEIIRLVLLILPILLIQLGLSIYALVDLARRRHTHGPRWLWAVLLVLTTLALPTGLIVAAVYLIWGRKEEEDDDGNDDSDR